jgi:hypothetical protein
MMSSSSRSSLRISKMRGWLIAVGVNNIVDIDGGHG